VKEVFVDPGMATAELAIWNGGGNRQAELAIYIHLLTWREWAGDKKGWTQFPLKWFAKECGFGFPRVKQALDHLMEMGLVERHEDSNRNGKREAGWFRALGLEKGEEVRKPAAPPPNPNEAAKERLIRTPVVEEGDPMVLVVDWDFQKGLPVLAMRPLSYGAALRECRMCRERFVRDTGRWDKHPGTCVRCGAYVDMEAGEVVFTHMGRDYPISDEFRKLVAKSVKK